jgi:hypothetical protein
MSRLPLTTALTDTWIIVNTKANRHLSHSAPEIQVLRADLPPKKSSKVRALTI